MMDDFALWRLGKCMFECKFCSKKFGVSTVFWHHIIEVHQIDRTIYKELHGNGLISSEKTTCQICDMEILFEFGALKSHVQKKHDGMDLKDYYEKFILSKDRVDYSDETNEESDDSDETESSSPSIKQQRLGIRFENYNNQELNLQFKPKEISFKDLKVWADQCTFNCASCDLDIKHFNDFLSHVKDTHHVELSTFEKIFGDFRKRIKLHECKLCGEQETHDLYFLTYHLEKIHKYCILEYYKTFIINDPQDQDVAEKTARIMPIVDKPVDNDQGTLTKIGKGLQTEKKIADDSKDSVHEVKKGKGRGATVKYPWLGRCTFYCAYCASELKLSYLSQFRSHLRDLHGQSYKDYFKIYGSGFLKKVSHQCLICGEPIENYGEQLAAHFRNTHSLTVAGYHDRFYEALQKETDGILITSVQISVPSSRARETKVYDKIDIDASNNCVLTCKICGITESLLSQFEIHLATHHAMTKKQHDEKNGDPVTKKFHDQCRVCEARILLEYDELDAHMKSHHLPIETYYKLYIEGQLGQKACLPVDKGKKKLPRKNAIGRARLKQFSWSKGCQFQCKICSFKELFSFSCFSNHIQQKHKIKLSMYTKQYGNSRIKSTLHQCRICLSLIMCEVSCVRSHLSRQHQMSLHYYDEIYMREPKIQSSKSFSTVYTGDSKDLSQVPKVKTIKVEEDITGTST